jgi:hypothetical protein
MRAKAMRLLADQHREIKRLLRRLRAAKAPDARRPLLATLRSRLDHHVRMEKDLFYPATRGLGTKKAEDLVFAALAEHRVAGLVLRDLGRIDAASDEFDAKARTLEHLVLHHAADEERQMFEIAERLGPARLEALGKRMSARAGDDTHRPRARKTQAAGPRSDRPTRTRHAPPPRARSRAQRAERDRQRVHERIDDQTANAEQLEATRPSSRKRRLERRLTPPQSDEDRARSGELDETSPKEEGQA